MRMLNVAAAVSVFALSGWLGAQGGACPDLVTEKIAPVVQATQPQPCGARIDGAFHGIRVQSAWNECPLLVVITPGHDASVHKRGAKTYTVPVQTLEIRLLVFKCVERWLFGVIPIAMSTECELQGDKNAGAVTHYAQRGCAVRASGLTPR